jgi:putative FmdB family regulatory protein
LPIYTYACDSCGAEIERRQSFSDPPLTVCESCGQALRRVLHPVGVIFKGSGFYNTDYKNATGKKDSPAAETAAKPAEKGSGGADSREGAKPADKPAAKPASAPAAAGSSATSTSSTPSSSGAS